MGFARLWSSKVKNNDLCVFHVCGAQKLKKDWFIGFSRLWNSKVNNAVVFIAC